MSALDAIGQGLNAAGNVARELAKGYLHEAGTNLGILPKGEIANVNEIPRPHMEAAADTMPLAKAVYQETGAPQGWNRLSHDQVRQDNPSMQNAVFSDPKTGFHADLFKNDEGKVVLSYRGTNELNDWKENFTQGFAQHANNNELSGQYKQAVDLAQQAKQAYGDDLIFTGHSLGGSLASAAAVSTGNEAYIYNAAGLSKESQAIIGNDLVEQNFHKVVNFNDTRDPVSNMNGNMQHTAAGGDIIGATYWIDHQNSPHQSLNPIENHGFDNLAHQLGIVF